jgi:ribose transport system substrate-binding protein
MIGNEEPLTSDDGAEDGSLAPITRRDLFIKGAPVVALGVLGLSARLGPLGLSDASASIDSAFSGIGPGLNITHLSQLKPFAFSSRVGVKPKLPRRLAIAMVDNDQIHLEMAAGIKEACHDRQVAYVEANALSNLATDVHNIQSFMQRGIGGIVIVPLGGTPTNVYKQVLNSGACLVNGLIGPSTLQQSASQYQVGYASGAAAASWFKQNMPGTAVKVAYLNPNALAPVLIARTDGALKALSTNSNINVINIGLTPDQWTPTGGYNVTASLLQAHSDLVGIVSGDAVIQGSVKAVQAASNTSVKYIGGVDGEAGVLAAIEAGGLIKSTLGFAQGAAGYATGQFVADWLDGKTIPQALVYTATKLDSVASIRRFQDQVKNPRKYWKDPAYVEFLGHISYGTRNRWIRNNLV